MTDYDYDSGKVRRDHEPGWYEGHFVDYKIGEFRETSKGSVADLDLFFTAERPIGDMNMEGVNPDRRLRRRISLWKDSGNEIVYDVLKNIDPDVPEPGKSGGAKLSTILDGVIAREVKVLVGADKFRMEKDGSYFPTVLQNKAAA